MKDTSSKFMTFNSKNMFEPKVPKCVVNMNFKNLNSWYSFDHQY